MRKYPHPSEGVVTHGLAPNRLKRAWKWILLVGVLSLTTSLLCARALRGENNVFLDLRCQGDALTVTVNGERQFAVQLDPTLPGDRVGLYVFHAFEEQGSQYFRHLDLHGVGVKATLGNRYLLTQAARDAHRFDALDGWAFDNVHGMTHGGAQGNRVVALVNDYRAREFELRIELRSVIDAGVLVRGADEHNGYVVVARPSLNDAFIFRLIDGEPGDIVGFSALQDLHVSTEALRLLKLVAGVVLNVCLLLLILCLPINWLVQRPGVQASPPSPLLNRKGVQHLVVVAMFLATCAAMATLAQCSLKAMPHLADETAYLFQAKIFAQNALVAPAPSHPEFFEHHHIINDGQSWYAKYPPVFPALLSIGVRLGAYWLVNPLLGALTALGMFLMVREMSNVRWAILAWMLALTSPFFLFMGANLMSHMTAALFITWHLYGVILMVRHGGWRWAILSGVCLGLCFMTRPFTAALVGSVTGVFVVLHACTRRRAPTKRAAVVGLLSCLPFILIYVAWNAHLAGGEHALTGLHSTYAANDTLGFGEDKGKGWLMTWGSWGHTPAKALRSTTRFLEYTAMHFLGWPAQLSFAFLLVPLVTRWRPRYTWLLLGAFIALVLGHMFYWATQHIGYGARYWFAAVPGLFALSAVGMGILMHAEDSGEDMRAITPRGCYVLLVVFLLIANNLFVYLPERAREAERYGDVTDSLRVALSTVDDPSFIVFVSTQDLLFNDGFYMNDPFLKANRIFARDLGERNGELLSAFPGYAGYTWDRQRLTKLPAERGH